MKPVHMKPTHEILDTLRFVDGLIPVVVQDTVSKEILMVAWMNRTALEKTLETGQTHFWSRSRGRLWHKGETSGHFQAVCAIDADCDYDTLRVEVHQTGVACHTGERSCFFHSLQVREGTSQPSPLPALRPLDALGKTIAARKAAPSSDSYTSRLMEGGIDAILKKVAEEAGEVIVSSKNNDPKAIVHEAADLVYHLLVTLAYHNLTLADVEAELHARTRQSGLAEKQARKKTSK